jgi:hypothetical protein
MLNIQPGYKSPYGPAGEHLSDDEKHQCEKAGLGVGDYSALIEAEIYHPGLDCRGFPHRELNGNPSTPDIKVSANPDRYGYDIALAFLRANGSRSWKHGSRGYYSYGMKHAAETWNR